VGNCRGKKKLEKGGSLTLTIFRGWAIDFLVRRGGKGRGGEKPWLDVLGGKKFREGR